MRTRILYKTLLLASLFFGACVQDDINDDPVANYSNEEKKDVVLIRMGTDDAEVKDITSRLFNNIPASWEIGKTTIVDYDKMADPETELNKMCIRDRNTGWSYHSVRHLRYILPAIRHNFPVVRQGNLLSFCRRLPYHGHKEYL